MRWTKYTIKTTTKDADMVSAILMDHDIFDVQIENKVPLSDEELNRMYADFVKELPPDDGSCDISFYAEFSDSEEHAAETEDMLKALERDLREASELFGIGPAELVCEDLNSDDWENNWKAFFQPFSVDRILIAPTWEEIPEDLSSVRSVEEVETFVHPEGETRKEPRGAHAAPDLIIRIDPGMAFGTGTHETTRLCLRALQQYVKKGDAILDLGCGSGILGIAAQKLGAEKIVSVDIDEQAVKTARENFTINEVPEEKSLFYTGNAAEDETLIQTILESEKDRFDILTINILADVIAKMMPGLSRYLKDGGILITSGILKEKEGLIRDALEQDPDLTLTGVQEDGDWVSITAERKARGGE